VEQLQRVGVVTVTVAVETLAVAVAVVFERENFSIIVKCYIYINYSSQSRYLDHLFRSLIYQKTNNYSNQITNLILFIIILQVYFK